MNKLEATKIVAMRDRGFGKQYMGGWEYKDKFYMSGITRDKKMEAVKDAKAMFYPNMFKHNSFTKIERIKETV